MPNNPDLRHLAHDLNNIFSRIMGNVDLLKKRLSGADDISSILKNIEASTYLASEIIEDAILSAQPQMKFKRVSLNAVINEIVNSTLIPPKKYEFKLKLESELKTVIGRYSDFYRLFLNLVTNSIEAVSENGCISITTRNLNAEKKVEIIITDNGKGIENKLLPFIFNDSFSTKSDISGYGLSIVKKIIELYDGSIEVESNVGKGSTFKIKLQAAESVEIKYDPTGKSILIAEDESVLRDLLVDLLQSYGYKVIPASNGQEMLDNFVKYPTLDLLLIDNKMPDMEGTDCIREIEKTNKAIPFILASGSEVETELHFTTEKFRFIRKPYNFEELLFHIRELTT